MKGYVTNCHITDFCKRYCLRRSSYLHRVLWGTVLVEPSVDEGHINGSASESRSHIEGSKRSGCGGEEKRKRLKKEMRWLATCHM